LKIQPFNGWLGREESNLRMTESKSDQFSFEINAHSEKIAKFDPLSTNRLAAHSECRRGRKRSPLDGQPIQRMSAFGGKAGVTRTSRNVSQINLGGRSRCRSRLGGFSGYAIHRALKSAIAFLSRRRVAEYILSDTIGGICGHHYDSAPLGRGYLLDGYPYRRTDRSRGCSRLRIQRWRR
jgi:hypothetical protein